MATFKTSGPPGPRPEPDPLEAAFAALPEAVVPESLLPALIAGMPGAGGYALGASVAAATQPAKPASVLATLVWWVGGFSALAACVAIAAFVVPLIRAGSQSLDASDLPGQAIASTSDFSSLTDNMTQLILKDTDPCRILPQQPN